MAPMYKLISLATVLTIFFLNNSDAQELKTKTRTVSGTTELYQVLKSSPKIMHGYYEKVTSWGQVVTRGLLGAAPRSNRSA